MNVDQAGECDVTVACVSLSAGPPADRLMQAKMNILPYDTCQSLLTINDTVHICVGSVPTPDVNICLVIIIIINCIYIVCNE